MEAVAHTGERRAQPPAGAAQPRVVTAVDVTPPAYAPGEDPNSWDERRRRAAEHLIPWIEQTSPLKGKTVLEYGCGNAPVSCAFAERCGRLIGLDIDADWIEYGRREVARRGLDNVELELHPVESILQAAAAHRGEVDVFLCYAVLEHLTIAERLAVLRMAREVVRSDGVIVVCEAPNRLIYLDHHTARMPFFHQLPVELALEYYRRSAREDFKRAVDEAGTDGGREAALEALVRWGNGVSYHEFEVVFGARLDRHVIACNYDPLLFSERQVHPDEVILARYLERWRPDLPPVFSRAWLDLILTPRPVEKRRPFVRPWAAETLGSTGVGWTAGETIYLAGPESTLWVTLPHPSSRLLVLAIPQSHKPLDLCARVEHTAAALSATLAGPAGHTWLATFELGERARRLALTASAACQIVFVGYED